MIHIVDTDERLKKYTGEANCGTLLENVTPISVFWNESNVCKKCSNIHKVLGSTKDCTKTYAFDIKEL